MGILCGSLLLGQVLASIHCSALLYFLLVKTIPKRIMKFLCSVHESSTSTSRLVSLYGKMIFRNQCLGVNILISFVELFLGLLGGQSRKYEHLFNIHMQYLLILYVSIKSLSSYWHLWFKSNCKKCTIFYFSLLLTSLFICEKFSFVWIMY